MSTLSHTTLNEQSEMTPPISEIVLCEIVEHIHVSFASFAIGNRHEFSTLTYFIVVKYKVQVKTGDIRGAGTDANVFLQLFGVNGDAGERKLESSGNNFERGHTDTFGIEAVDLGDLIKARVRHDGSGFGSAWFLGT